MVLVPIKAAILGSPARCRLCGDALIYFLHSSTIAASALSHLAAHAFSFAEHDSLNPKPSSPSSVFELDCNLKISIVLGLRLLGYILYDL